VATNFSYNSSFSNGMAPAAGLAMRPALLGISQFDEMHQTVYLKPGTAESPGARIPGRSSSGLADLPIQLSKESPRLISNDTEANKLRKEADVETLFAELSG
jgi:hypothetical protein